MRKLVTVLVMLAVVLPAGYGGYRWRVAWMRSIARQEAEKVFGTRSLQRDISLRDLDERLRACERQLATEE